MSKEIEAGLAFELKEKVVKEKTAAMIGSGLLEVYSTPSMIALMENTAFQCVQSHLNEGDTTVGSEVNIRHLKPTALNKEVSAKATVTEVDGRKLVFSVEAFDEDGKIGAGTHTRYIVNNERFMQKI